MTKQPPPSTPEGRGDGPLPPSRSADTIGAPLHLEYGAPAPKPPRQWGRLIGGALVGLIYAVAAGFVSAALADALTKTHEPYGRSTLDPGLAWLIPAILLGLPFITSLLFRGWRSFAIGMLLLPGLFLLLVGICFGGVYARRHGF